MFLCSATNIRNINRNRGLYKPTTLFAIKFSMLIEKPSEYAFKKKSLVIIFQRAYCWYPIPKVQLFIGKRKGKIWQDRGILKLQVHLFITWKMNNVPHLCNGYYYIRSSKLPRS